MGHQTLWVSPDLYEATRLAWPESDVVCDETLVPGTWLLGNREVRKSVIKANSVKVSIRTLTPEDLT